VWIDCTGENGISLGWFEGLIKSKTKNDEYLVRLVQDPEYYAILPDLFDEIKLDLRAASQKKPLNLIYYAVFHFLHLQQN
ncbi:Uncharacterized protein APZ42_003571, partial [Daphnia magna]